MFRRRATYGPIGLDIGASGVKLVQFLNAGDKPTVVAAAHRAIPPSPDEPEQRRAAVCQAVAEALKQHPFQGRDVVTALGFSEFQTKNIRLPRMPAEEKASAIGFEAQDRFGMDADRGQFRYITAGEVRHGNELKEEIIVFAASNEAVNARLSLLESLRLRATAIDIAPCAMARGFMRFLRRAEDADVVNVFLDVGWRGASVVLTRGTELSFLKLIDAGGEQFSEAAAKALGISRCKVSELRVRIMGEAGDRRTIDKASVPEEVLATVADAVRPIVERIAREVQLCLRYFAVTFRGKRPQSLTLVGGEAHEPSLKRIISESIDVPCTIGNPLRGVAWHGPMVGGDKRSFQPAWAVCCGLALRGSKWVRTPESHIAVQAALGGVTTATV